MKYILDTADLAAIKHYNEFYPLSGVTTNPSIIAKEKTDFLTLVKNIRDIIGPDKLLCVQTLEKTCEGIVKDAEMLNKAVGGNFYIKIPIGEAGLKATPIVKKMGIGVLMTAIFTPAQALIAAEAGADLVAPYVNRLDNVVVDGTQVVAEIVKQFNNYGYACGVLAASFKNVEQVNKCASVGCQYVTVGPDILKGVVAHPLTDVAVAGFDKDWAGVYGEKSIKDLL